jgi:hypothetical protein
MISAIQLEQKIVEGAFVATVFDIETVKESQKKSQAMPSQPR